MTPCPRRDPAESSGSGYRDAGAAAFSDTTLLTHFSMTSAIWSEFFSSIIMWPERPSYDECEAERDRISAEARAAPY